MGRSLPGCVYLPGGITPSGKLPGRAGPPSGQVWSGLPRVPWLLLALQCFRSLSLRSHQASQQRTKPLIIFGCHSSAPWCRMSKCPAVTDVIRSRGTRSQPWTVSLLSQRQQLTVCTLSFRPWQVHCLPGLKHSGLGFFRTLLLLNSGS